VLCEDTRHSRPLLDRVAAAAGGGRRPAPLSLHAHNEAARVDAVLRALGAGQAVAIISDAGTPCVSDPGGVVAAAAAAAGHAVVPIPGPCAAAAAVSACGLNVADFLFLGFLPPKPAARRARLADVASLPAALVAYAPARALPAVLADAAAALGGGRRVAVAREMTKVHEEWWRGALADGAAAFGDREGALKGEVTFVVEAPPRAAPGERRAGAFDERAALASLLAAGVSPSAAARALAAGLGVPRGRLYEAALEMGAQNGESE
jgi:16S rRNA (cytidine1402-2'-O)-methyltransferase